VEVERLKQEYDLIAEFAPFYLHPETPSEGMPSRRVTPPDAPPSPIELRGRALGITFSRGRRRTSNSYLALQAAEFAADHGDGWRFHRAMFKAYFEDLADIGQVDTIVGVGKDAGLDAAELRAALEDGRYRELVDEGLAMSRRIGVTAIPTFVFDGRLGMVGAQELPAFREMMRQVGREPRPGRAPTP
jgi:predicted DsbA family dithiol-disulfide isomerase